MAYDRARRPGEDVIKYAVETQRIAASSADSWRTILRGPGMTEQFIENLATPLRPDPNSRAQPRKAQPVAAATGDKLSPQANAKLKAALGLPTTATGAQALAALDKLVAKKTSAPVAPIAAAKSAPQPAVQAVDASRNPAVAELQQQYPQMFRDAVAASGGTVPGLFGSSDLPSVTASGMAPSELLKAHWMARPAIAAAKDPNEAQEMLQLASGPDADGMVRSLPEFVGHPGVRDYLMEVRDWADRGAAVMQQRQEAAQVAAARQQQLAAAAAVPDTAEAAYEALIKPLEDREIAYAEEFDRAARNATSVAPHPNARVLMGRRLKAEREGRQ